MKYSKFYRAIIAVVMMLIGWLPSLANEFEVNGIIYNTTSDKTVKVAFVNSSYIGDVVIPSSIVYKGTTYSVTCIGAAAFYECTSLTSIEIPNSVTKILDEAFHKCSSLTSVTWNVVRCNDFEPYAYAPFYGCSNITSFTFGEGVEYIPAYLCYGLKSLTKVEIPNSVTSIGVGAFANCSGLTNIEPSSGV